MKEKTYSNIDEYISSFSEEIQDILQQIRKTIKESAPEAVETISWQMPTFKLKENLAHFAVHKNHIGFYPGPEAIIAFKDNLKEYKTSKGAIQFPLDKDIPYTLISKIVKYRVKNIK